MAALATMLTTAVLSQNQAFKDHLASLSVPVLRVVNSRDIVPKIPGAAQRWRPALGGTLHLNLLAVSLPGLSR